MEETREIDMNAGGSGLERDLDAQGRPRIYALPASISFTAGDRSGQTLETIDEGGLDEKARKLMREENLSYEEALIAASNE